MRGPFSGVVAMVAMLAGCSAVLGIDDLHPPTLHGTLSDIDGNTVSNVSIALYREPKSGAPNGTLIGQVTTDREGRFEFPLTMGLPLQGYLELADQNLVRTVSHLTQPVGDHADFGVDVRTLTPARLRMLATDAHMMQDPSRSVVVVQVVDASVGGVHGATVHAHDEDTGMDILQICAADESTSLPCVTGTTREGGLAWLFDVPATTALTITAVDDGGQSHAASVRVVAGPSLVFTPVPPVPTAP